jgi:hypothetical protein
MIIEKNSETGRESDLAMERGGTSCEVKPRTRNRNMNATVIQVNHGTRTCCIFHKGNLSTVDEFPMSFRRVLSKHEFSL